MGSSGRRDAPPPPPPLQQQPDHPPDSILLPAPSSRRMSSRSRNSAAESTSSISFAPDVRSGPPPSAPPQVRLGSVGRSNSMGGSYRDIPDSEARFVYINEVDQTNHPFRLPNNSIRTTKYSVLTFLPRNLFEQFHRVAYVYFLVLVILNQIPQLAVYGREISVLPLAFVLAVTAIKDGWEDWRRHQSDVGENKQMASVYVAGDFESKRWKDILVGEVVRVRSNETIPCDMVLLATSDPTGVAYIQTVNLDGESNLKTRYAKQETMNQFNRSGRFASSRGFSGLVRCEQPNRNIYGFHANLEVGEGKRVSLGPGNLVLRGCELKNTAWIVGVAVYTGRDTKVMLNNSGAPSKRSRVESSMNRETIMLAVILFIQCFIVMTFAGIWLHIHKDELDILQYYRKEDFSGSPKSGNWTYYGYGLQVVFTFFQAVIQFQVMVPISLYISMELVRLVQAYFMIQDDQMYYETTDSRFQCRALNINEDLGQIKYVFSDKTGTLTENKMEFRRASVAGIDYSDGGEETDKSETGYAITIDDGLWRPKMTLKTDPKLVDLLRSDEPTERRDRARDFFLALATCNTIVPLMVEASDPSLKLIDYQGESPDEVALAYAAAAYGYVLVERTSGYIVIDILGERLRYVGSLIALSHF